MKAKAPIELSKPYSVEISDYMSANKRREKVVDFIKEYIEILSSGN